RPAQRDKAGAPGGKGGDKPGSDARAPRRAEGGKAGKPGKSGKPPRRDDGPRRFSAAPDKKRERIDPDNPFAAALMGLKDKS
ncbi:MAG: hypothetical protein JJT95_15985, partial [Pararhodobacter sp.]|nr:hypothetical protein [Pararhodobacter sp.]